MRQVWVSADTQLCIMYSIMSKAHYDHYHEIVDRLYMILHDTHGDWVTFDFEPIPVVEKEKVIAFLAMEDERD